MNWRSPPLMKMLFSEESSRRWESALLDDFPLEILSEAKKDKTLAVILSEAKNLRRTYE